MKIAAAAVLASSEMDLSRPAPRRARAALTPKVNGMLRPVERGGLDEFLNDPKLQEFFQLHIPVIACFEDEADSAECRAAVPPPVATVV